MEEAVVAMFAIFTIFIACPGMIMYFLSKRREHESRLAGSPAMNADLQRIAEKLERRVQSLETILESEIPGGRKHLDRREP